MKQMQQKIEQSMLQSYNVNMVLSKALLKMLQKVTVRLNNTEQLATPEIKLLKVRLEMVEKQLELERHEKQQLLKIVESQAESMKQLSPPKDQKRNWLQRLFNL